MLYDRSPKGLYWTAVYWRAELHSPSFSLFGFWLIAKCGNFRVVRREPVRSPEEFGPDQRTVDEAVRALTGQPALRELLADADTRLLAVDLLDPVRKVARPRPATRVRVTYFDYTSNRTVAAEEPLEEPAPPPATSTPRAMSDSSATSPPRSTTPRSSALRSRSTGTGRRPSPS
jgi:hypothetical protein